MATKRSEIEKELLTDANLIKVIGLLNPEDVKDKPITKKTACAILGIAYNTTRLTSLIEAYLERVKYTAERRKANKGKKVTEQETVLAIQSYIEGESVAAIAKMLFRSTGFVNRILDKAGVTLRALSHDYFIPEQIPDVAVRSEFAIGEVVYSAKYNANAIVKREMPDQAQLGHGKVYRVLLLGEEQKSAYTPAYELASLTHLVALGVKV